MSKVPPFWEEKYKREAPKNWNLFYKRNEARFFKDRHWTGREFPELFDEKTSTVVEVGCGVGNFALPLLSEQETLSHLYACDFSEKAIELLKTDDRYNPKRCTAFVADLTVPGSLSQAVPLDSADIVTSIFVLSALPPEKFVLAVENVKSVLKEGGLWLIRDYAVNDAAQLRFKEDRKISESLYVRQDGTLSYFFDKDELSNLATSNGFEVVSCDYVQAKTTNLKKDLDVERTFVQAKFRLKAKEMMNEYQVVGRKLATANQPAGEQQLYKMRIFAPNEVVAKSRFFYFLQKMKKVKKATGEIVSCNQVFEKKPMKVKNFGVWIRYDSRSGTHNMYKEYREFSRTEAIKSCYQDLAARHRARFRSIHIIKITELTTAQVRRPYIQQLIDPKLKFPLPHRVARSFRPVFAGKRPSTF